MDPVNDSPFIQVPGYIVLMSDADESQILDRETNKFDFSIGEPGAFNYPGMFNSIFLFNSLQILLTLLYDSGGTSRFFSHIFHGS